MKIVSGYLPLMASVTIVLLFLAVGLLISRLVLSRLAQWNLFLVSLKYPLPIWFLLGGAFFAIRFSGVPPALAPIIEKLLHATLIVSVTIWAANLAANLLCLGGAKATSATGVVRNVVRIAVLVVGGLMLLNTLGVSIAPLTTTAGLGGLAFALGLQNTVSNLFAGMEMTLEGNIRVGDFVKLETGEEGYIDDIHWRTTRVRTLFNQFVLIPNSRIVDSVVSNYHLPTKSYVILIPAGVHPASDLEQVERITLAVARKVLTTIPGGVSDFEPFLRYNAFGESTINFNVILRVEEFKDHFLIRHEFIKQLARAYAREGIVIPFPTRVIRVEQGDAKERAISKWSA